MATRCKFRHFFVINLKRWEGKSRNERRNDRIKYVKVSLLRGANLSCDPHLLIDKDYTVILFLSSPFTIIVEQLFSIVLRFLPSDLMG